MWPLGLVSDHLYWLFGLLAPAARPRPGLWALAHRRPHGLVFFPQERTGFNHRPALVVLAGAGLASSVNRPVAALLIVLPTQRHRISTVAKRPGA
jgi:hypothetical protein